MNRSIETPFWRRVVRFGGLPSFFHFEVQWRRPRPRAIVSIHKEATAVRPDQGVSTTLMQPSLLSRNVLYAAGASSSFTRWALPWQAGCERVWSRRRSRADSRLGLLLGDHSVLGRRIQVRLGRAPRASVGPCGGGRESSG